MELIHNISISDLKKVRRNPISKKSEVYQYKEIESPVGPMVLIASATALHSLGWSKYLRDEMTLEPARNNPVIRATEIQLQEYFRGKRKSFDVPLSPAGTDFQQRVWAELSKIPYGQTITYGEQARRIGRPKSVRAVGAANGKNPIAIIIPCHRVIGASGSLTGFAAGIEIKRKLLERECGARSYTWAQGAQV